MTRLSARSALISTILILTLIECTYEGDRRLPRHSGESGEVLVVMNQNQWLSGPGDSLRNILESYYPFLPQAEPKFTLFHFSSNEMNNLLRQHRNIVEIIIGPDAEGDNKIAVSHDRWSSHQLVFSIKAENEDSFYKLLQSDIGQLIALIDETEVERITRKYKAQNNVKLANSIMDKFGVSLALPIDMKLAKEEPNFIWLSRERVKYQGNTGHDITQGLFIYVYPYHSEMQFSTDSILAIRDSILKEYVPGPAENTYMATEYRLIPESEEIQINGRYAKITRGLWRTENYFMGGPFLSLTTTINSGSELICVSGFVFAPKFNKREYIREIEAILRSARFETQAESNS